MSSRTVLRQRQSEWASTSHKPIDARGYVADIALNLFQPLSESTMRAFSSGSGSELLPGARRPPKMAALHSSAALAVNVFDYWSNRPLQSLAAALGLPATPSAFRFEAQFPTGLGGTPPNLDLAFEYPDQRIVGVESKFTEWLTPKRTGPAPFKDKYCSGKALWSSAGLPRAQALAESMQARAQRFVYLDAAQLLKHMLGLSTCLRGRAGLCYLYFDCAGPESSMHQAEIHSFSTAIDPDMPFHAISYQTFFEALTRQLDPSDGEYVAYLKARYFQDGSSVDAPNAVSSTEAHSD